MTILIGIDIGGTNLRLGVVGFQTNEAQTLYLIEEVRFQADFSSLCKTHASQPNQAWQSILNTIADAVQSVRQKYPQVSAVGIGFPGFIDPNTQKISQSPNLPGLSNVDLSADLSQIIQLPVITENDALVAAYGEFSRQADLEHLIYLGLGTGVGGGLVLNGKPWQGAHGVAMEAGHIIFAPKGRLCGCGNLGCMEQYASASGVSISYFVTTGEHCSATEIAQRANQGDVAAQGAYALAGSSLAQALAHMLKVIDVKDVIIGGGMSGAWTLMQAAFYAQMEQDLIPALRSKVNVKISTMGDQAGVIGAAMLAYQHLSQNA